MIYHIMVSRTYVKRRFKRKARPVRRSMRMAMPRLRLTQGKLYAFKRTVALKSYAYVAGAWSKQSNNVISNQTTLTNGSGIFKFRLSDLPGYTDFTSLYEQFKITGVKLKFIPYLGTEASSSSSSLTDTLVLCIDRGANDIATANPTFDGLLENQDVKLRNTQKPFSIWIGKVTAHQPVDATEQTAYVRPWLDSEISTSPEVDHHGLKFVFSAGNNQSAANSCSFKVYATYYIKCRNPQ